MIILKRVKKRKRNAGTRKLLMVSHKNAPFAYVEAYKSLRTNLKFLMKTDDVKSFVITSAISEESKSSTAINLAITLAQDGKNVVLVDCDLRRPALQKYMRMNRGRKGLTNILLGEEELENCIVNFPELNVNILFSGMVPPNPSELLSSDTMEEIISFLKKEYDYVILDAPPILAVTDAAILGNIVDGALLVVRSDFVPADVVVSAKQKLEEVGVKILGVVLTCFDVKNSPKKSKYSYSYGYEYRKKQHSRENVKGYGSF